MLDPTHTRTQKRWITLVAYASAALAAALAVPASNAAADQNSVHVLVEDNNRFAFELYHQLAQADGNVVFSPFSVSQAMAMSSAGATGKTLREIRSACSFELPDGVLHSVFRELGRELTDNHDEGSPLQIVTSLWGQDGYPFLEPFIRDIREGYFASAHAVDFRSSPAEATTRLNRWVGRKTEGRIDSLVSSREINKLTRAVLVSIVNFDGRWQSFFPAELTEAGPFLHPQGTETSVPMMRGQFTTGHGYGEGFRALELDFEDGVFSMLLVVPDEDAFEVVERSWSADRVAGILDTMYSEELVVMMPKLSLSSSIRLVPALRELGVRRAFEEEAEFDRMTADPAGLMISDIAHQTVLTVDEEGASASSGSAVVYKRKGGPRPFFVNRSFLLVVRHRDSGAIVLLGRVNDPGGTNA